MDSQRNSDRLLGNRFHESGPRRPTVPECDIAEHVIISALGRARCRWSYPDSSASRQVAVASRFSGHGATRLLDYRVAGRTLVSLAFPASDVDPPATLEVPVSVLRVFAFDVPGTICIHGVDPLSGVLSTLRRHSVAGLATLPRPAAAPDSEHSCLSPRHRHHLSLAARTVRSWPRGANGRGRSGRVVGARRLHRHWSRWFQKMANRRVWPTG
jgi:hypothetical protein